MLRFAHWIRQHVRISTAVFVIPLAAYLVVFLAAGEAFRPAPDGFYSWLFARSLVFDGDFDFANDYALCGDEFHMGIDHGTGRPDNPFYVGPAIFFTPGLLVLRLVWTVALGAKAAEIASCGSWMTVLGLLVGPLAGALTVWLSYRTACFFVRGRVAAVMSLFFAFSSPLFGYSTTIAQYSHVYLTLCVALLTYLAVRCVVSADLSHRAWYGVGITLTVAVLHRLPAVLYAAIPAAAAFAELRRRSKVRWVAMGSVVLGPLAGILLTFGVYLYLYGTIFITPQGSYYLHLSQPHPVLLLFGVHGGFFFWMPAAWLSVVGIPFALVQPRARLLLIACLLAAAGEIYVSSSVLDWSARFSLGARRLLPLTPFVVVFASIAVERFVAGFDAWVHSPKIRSRFHVVFYAVAVSAVALTLINNIPPTTIIRFRHAQMTQEELYGAWSPFRRLWAFADRTIGDVALLPAQVYFRYRYGLSPAGYREVMLPRFSLSMRTLAVDADEISFRAPWVQKVSAGFAFTADGAHLAGQEGRVVFASEWATATHIHVLARTDRPVELRMARGAKQPPFARLNLVPSAEPSWTELEVPRGALQSGVNEWIFQTSELADVTVVSVRLEDRTPPPPAGETPRPELQPR